MSFVGKYERNCDEILKMLRPGAKYLLRKTLQLPVLEMNEDCGVWTIKTFNTPKTLELKFKLGEEFEETTDDGRDVTTIVTQEGNKFISVQTAKKEGQNSTRVVWEFLDDQMIWTMEILGNDLVSKQVFKRI